MYLWHVYSRAVVFHTLHIGQRDTILPPKWLNVLRVFCTGAPSRESSFFPYLSLLPSILFRLRRRCRIPCPRHFNERLLPPSHPHPCPWCHICLLKKTQKISRSNVLQDCVLPLTNVFLYHPKTCLLSFRHHQGVLSLPAWFPPWDLPRHMPHHLVL